MDYDRLRLGRLCRSGCQTIQWMIRLPVLMLLMDIEGGAARNVRQIKEKVAQNKYKLYCLMLYSDLDRSFISFVQEAHDAIAIMSGPEMFVFWLEHFKDDISILLPEIENVDEALDRNYSIRLARMLDIPNKRLPCLVFFRTLDSTDAIAYSFDNSWDFLHMGEHVKAVFDATNDTLASIRNGDEESAIRKLNSTLRKIKLGKWVERIATRQSLETLLKAAATGGAIV